jgi:hypothetical protein
MKLRSRRTALTLVAAGAVAIGGPAAAWGQSNPAPVKRHYHPHIDPAKFGRKIDNRYLPFRPGTRTVAKGVAENGKTPQRDAQVVTDRKRKVDGVKCVVVRDTITSRGKPVERTFDWYTQDKHGNVWYFGENSKGRLTMATRPPFRAARHNSRNPESTLPRLAQIGGGFSSFPAAQWPDRPRPQQGLGVP